MNPENATNEQWDATLIKIIDEENSKPSQLLTIPGVYETLSEHFHNAVWDRLKDETKSDD